MIVWTKLNFQIPKSFLSKYAFNILSLCDCMIDYSSAADALKCVYKWERLKLLKFDSQIISIFGPEVTKLDTCATRWVKRGDLY